MTALALRDDQTTLTDAQFDALNIKRNTSPAAVAAFIAVCNRTQLDPFVRQVYLVERGGKATVQVGIDGMRLVAHRAATRAGDTLSYEDTLWCGDDGQWTDVWLGRGAPAAAKVVVVRSHRDGTVSRFPAVARTSAYSAGGNMWSSMPDVMVAKCAEAQALRKAAPQDLSDVYTDDEMQQADAPQRQPRRQPKVLDAPAERVWTAEEKAAAVGYAARADAAAGELDRQKVVDVYNEAAAAGVVECPLPDGTRLVEELTRCREQAKAVAA